MQWAARAGARRAREPISVVQVIGRFGGGGAERLAYNLAVGLGELGTRSFAIALRRAELGGEMVPGVVELSELRAAGRRPVSVVRAFFRFRRFVHRRGIDVVHVHGHHTLFFCAAATLGMRRRPRLLYTWHSPERVITDPGLSMALMRWALRRCDRVYGPSREVASRLTSGIRLCRPAAVFRNGVAAAEAARASGPPAGGRIREPVIVWAARIVPTKDPQLLVRAVARLHAEGLAFRVILAGAAPAAQQWYLDETLDLIRRHRLEDVIEMPGWVGDPAGLFQCASIAVQSSRTEGLSLSLLEQMMAGLAIVATDVGDTSTAIHDGETGVLIPTDDEAALVAALRQLILRPGLRSRLGRQAREYAVREFTLPRMAERASREYREILGDDRSPDASAAPAAAGWVPAVARHRDPAQGLMEPNDAKQDQP